MLKKDVVIPGRYIAKVGGVLTIVRVTGEHVFGNYAAVNERTNREVRIKSAAKLRRPVADDFTIERWDAAVRKRIDAQKLSA